MFSSFRQPRSSAELNAFVSELEAIQGSLPERDVVVLGGVPSGRVVGFRYPEDTYYVIPYPE
jgi:hypothetical protein